MSQLKHKIITYSEERERVENERRLALGKLAEIVCVSLSYHCINQYHSWQLTLSPYFTPNVSHFQIIAD
jgi:hypothetical protein